MSPFLRLLPMIALSGLCCCNSNTGNDNAVPRRHAYPRIETPDSVFTSIGVGSDSLIIDINSAASHVMHIADNGDTRFIDVVYPQLNTTIFFTVTPTVRIDINEVISNRLERIRLNLGDSDAELLEFATPAGFESKVFVSRGDISTPIQFISTDGSTVVVSGAAFVKDASASNADSISPVTEMLQRDIIHALKTMHR